MHFDTCFRHLLPLYGNHFFFVLRKFSRKPVAIAAEKIEVEVRTRDKLEEPIKPAALKKVKLSKQRPKKRRRPKVVRSYQIDNSFDKVELLFH